MTADPAAVLQELERQLEEACAGPADALLPVVDQILARLATVPLDALPAQRIKLLVDAASQYYLDGTNVARAAQPLAFAVLLAERTQDRVSLRRALSVQGVVLSSMRDSSGALRTLTRAADIAQELGDQLGLATAWVNIGLVYNEAMLSEDARRGYAEAMRLIDVESADPYRKYLLAIALHGDGVASYELMDFPAGIQAAERAISILREPESREMQQVLALHHATYVRHLLASNRLADAEVQAERCEAMAALCGFARARVESMSTHALVLLHKGETEAAFQILTQVEGSSRARPGSWQEFLKTMIAANERAGRYDAAITAYRNYLAEVHRSRFQVLHARAGASSLAVGHAAEARSRPPDDNLPALAALAQRMRTRLGVSSQMALSLA